MNTIENTTLQEPVERDSPLKEWLVEYVGNQEKPENGNVTVEMIVVSFFTSFLCLMVGIIYFSKTERIFADVV